MTMPYKAARVPGPLGTTPEISGGGGSGPWGRGVSGPWGGRIPGPLGFEHVDLTKGMATKAAAQTFPMPAPAGGSTTIIRARAVDWKLDNGSPIPEDVLQGELAVCPIAAILAALAHTTSGRARLNKLIKEYKGATVKTTFDNDIVTALRKRYDDPDYKAPAKEITSNRYFEVMLDGVVSVSDVFYTKYSDGSDVDMVYMGSAKSALWPCVIEKGYARKIGTYEELDDDNKHKVAEFWSTLVGPPGGFDVTDKTDLKRITDAAKAASQTPTIAASRDSATAVLSHHGFAILGMRDSKIELYDPHGKTVTISQEDFRKNFKAVFFGKPK